MQKLLNLGIALQFFFILSCGQKNDGVQKSAPPADTSAVTQEVQGETAEADLFEMTYAERKGKRLYDHYCTVCHGTEGKGDGFNAYNLNPKPKDMTEKGYLDSVTNDWLMQAIRQGGRGVKQSALMPSYEQTLSEVQTQDVVAYLRYLSR